jgi:hypothetical protein
MKQITLTAPSDVAADAAKTVCSISQRDGSPLLGPSVMQPLGEDALVDMLYRLAWLTVMQQRTVNLSRMASNAERERMQREALAATNDADEAARTGAMLSNILRAKTGNKHIQIEETTNGRFIVNKLGTGISLADALESYYRKAILRERS